MIEIDRHERLLALILVSLNKAATQREKIQLLNLAGFSNVEIADIIQATTPVVAQTLYSTRQAKRKP